MMRKLSFVNASQMFALEQIARPIENVARMGNGNGFMAFERAMQRIYSIQLQYQCEIEWRITQSECGMQKGAFYFKPFLQAIYQKPADFRLWS